MVTCTGAVADHRLPLRPSEVEAFVRALAAKFGLAAGTPGELPELARKWVDPLHDDLTKNPGAAVVVDNKVQPGNEAAPKPEDN